MFPISCWRLFYSSCLLFLRLDFGVVSVAKFYKKNPSVSQKNFPRLSDPNRRGMWSKAGKIVTEAATNPQVQAIAIGVTGALAWKVLEVYDTQTQKEIADADRVEQSKQHKETLEAESQRHTEILKAESQQHTETLAAEAAQQASAREAESREREKDRLEENKRAAFDKISSADFINLSEERQAFVKQVAEDGKIS